MLDIDIQGACAGFDRDTEIQRLRMALRGDPAHEIAEYTEARENLRRELCDELFGPACAD